MRPERRRKVRRSSVPPDCEASDAASEPRRGLTFGSSDQHGRLLSSGTGSLRRTAALHVIRLPVAGLPLLIVAFVVSASLGGKRRRGGSPSARAERPKEVATAELCLVFPFHRFLLRIAGRAAHEGSAKA